MDNVKQSPRIDAQPVAPERTSGQEVLDTLMCQIDMLEDRATALSNRLTPIIRCVPRRPEEAVVPECSYPEYFAIIDNQNSRLKRLVVNIETLLDNIDL